MGRIALVIGLVVALACGGACAGPLPEAEERCEAQLGGTSMRDTPWPSDVFLREGRLDVGEIPLDGAPGPLAALAATLEELDGAPAYGSVFFPTSTAGGRSLPHGPLEGSARWLDLDAKDTEGRARRVATTSLFYRAETEEVVAMAPSDVVLSAGHRHAVIIASPRVAPAPAMREALEGRGPRAALYAAIAPELALPGDSAATVFTVGRPTKIVDRMRDVGARLRAPAGAVARVFRGADLDDLLGHPTTTRPGLGDPAGVVHDQLEAVVLGTFDGPSFLSATPARLGRIELDAEGAPMVKGDETIPFLLALPKKPAAGWSKLPILVFQHGLNAGRSQVLTTANDYARAGYATIGIDAVWHADRAVNKRDERHNFTGKVGPDGLADADDFGASVWLFDFGGDEAQGIVPFDGRVVRDNLRQAIVDVATLVRFVRESDPSFLATADAGLEGLTFDAESLVYTGESFGSVIGASALAVIPDLHAAVLSVGGGGIFLPILPRSPMFAGLITPFLKTSFDASLDLSDPARLPAEAQRSLSLVQAAIAPGDPLAFAPLYAERHKRALFLMAKDDELIPNRSTELLVAAAGPNAGLVRFEPALHTMFTAFSGERRYAPGPPPFVTLEEPQKIDCPIELAHDLAIGFARAAREVADHVSR